MSTYILILVNFIVICAFNFQIFEALPVIGNEVEEDIKSVPRREESGATRNSTKNTVGHEVRSYPSFSQCYNGCLRRINTSRDDDTKSSDITQPKTITIHLNRGNSPLLPVSRRSTTNTTTNNNRIIIHLSSHNNAGSSSNTGGTSNSNVLSRLFNINALVNSDGEPLRQFLQHIGSNGGSLRVDDSHHSTDKQWYCSKTCTEQLFHYYQNGHVFG